MRKSFWRIVAPIILTVPIALHAAIDLGDSPSKGNANAAVLLIEYSDYQCPSCGYYMRQVYPRLNRDYVRTGKLRYVVKNFPIERVHPLAFQAHQAAMCAAEQGKFWEMHDRLFAHQEALAPELLEGYAAEAGLVPAMFSLCMGSGRTAVIIRRDMTAALATGVQATPTIVLGANVPGSASLQAQRVIVGEHPYEDYRSAIEAIAQSR